MIEARIQLAASDMAYEIRNTFADRMTVEQNVRMECLTLLSPERLTLAQAGSAIAMWAQLVSSRA